MMHLIWGLRKVGHQSPLLALAQAQELATAAAVWNAPFWNRWSYEG